MTSPRIGTLHSTPGGFSGPRTSARGVDSKIKGGTSMRTTEMGTPITRYCLALMALLLLASGAFAQSTTNGAIGGTVTDQSGAVVPNARVSTKNLGTGASASGKSDEVGRFLITHLAPGEYSVEITASGIAPYTATSLTVRVRISTTLSPHPCSPTQTYTHT